jgi:uncharacterized membrane protein YeaQ/YmgE (transglycosylase-associated protein family)
LLIARTALPSVARGLTLEEERYAELHYLNCSGRIVGWLASIVMKTDAQQGIFLNVVVRIIGALLGGWLLSPLLGSGTINQNDFSLSRLFVSFLGAIVLLAIVRLVRR